MIFSLLFRSAHLLFFPLFLFFSVPDVHSRSPHLPGFRHGGSSKNLSCSNEYVSVSLSGYRPEILLRHAFKSWDRVSSSLGYSPFDHSASASIEIRRHLDFSGSLVWNLDLRAKPCTSIHAK